MRWELCFFILLLGGRIWLLFQRFDESIGFDASPHLSHLAAITWSDFDKPLNSGFYAHHLPLSFLLARTIYVLGFSLASSVQIVAFSGSLLSFFFLRLTLKHLNLLSQPRAIVFLYVTSCLPIQMYLATRINMDILVLTFNTIALYLSVRLFWSSEFRLDTKSTRTAFLLEAMLLVIVMCLALMTKSSGLLVLIIPIFVALPHLLSLRRIHIFSSAICVSCLALLMVLPYYYGRYYVPLGTLVPAQYATRGGLLEEHSELFDSSRIQRDKDRLGFFLNLISPIPAQSDMDPGFRDYETIRFANTWRDVWSGDSVRVPMNDTAKSVARFYLSLMPWLFLTGLVIFLVRSLELGSLQRLGWVFFFVFLIQIAALVVFSYKNPYAGWRPEKATYIAPALWFLGYIFAQCFDMSWLLSRCTTRYYKWTPHIVVILIASFILANHFIPVY